MVGPATDSEYLLARKTAEEYRSNGYEVQLEALLDFFSNFQADLLVRKGDEVKVIEVKLRPSLAADPRISELAQLIESKPGWSFELVLVGEPERVDSPAGALPFESQGILRRLEQAEMPSSGNTGGRLRAGLVGWRSRSLAGMLRYRNAIVHGFSTDGLNDALVSELIGRVRALQPLQLTKAVLKIHMLSDGIPASKS